MLREKLILIKGYSRGLQLKVIWYNRLTFRISPVENPLSWQRQRLLIKR